MNNRAIKEIKQYQRRNCIKMHNLDNIALVKAETDEQNAYFDHNQFEKYIVAKLTY